MSYIAKNGRLYTSGASEALTLLDDKFSVNKSYSKGDSCIYNDYLWKFTSDKPAGEWDSSVVEQCRIMDFVDEVRGQICTNLLNPTAPTQTVNGVTCTNNGDGTYTVNGMASNNDALITFFIINDTNLSVSTFQNSKLVGCPKGGSDGTYFISCDLNHGGTWVGGYPDIGNGVIVSNIPSDTDRLMATIVIRKGTTVNNLIFKPMLTTDLSATYDDFVPYTGDSGRLNEDISDINGRLTQCDFGTEVDLENTSETKLFTFPNDGYIRLYASNNGSALVRIFGSSNSSDYVQISVNGTANVNDMNSIYVRKGMKCYYKRVTGTGNAKFIPLI